MAALASTLGPEDSIRAWCESVLPRVRALRMDVAGRYSNSRLLTHYGGLARQLACYSLPLAQAAFLHGIWDRDLLPHLGQIITDEVKEILEDRIRLWSINAQGADIPHLLKSHVLPALRRPSAALLLVEEQLNHVDPEGKFDEFERSFAVRPTPPPCLDDPIPSGFQDLTAQVAFLRCVVAAASRFLGLWFQTYLAEDLALYYSDRTRFTELTTFASAEETWTELQHRVRLVRAVLSGTQFDVLWIWHNVASLSDKLGPIPKSWQQLLSICGMVTVVCSSENSCYDALAALHLSPEFEHRTREIEDYLGHPTIAGYQAIHTILTPKSSEQTVGSLPSIRVRVMPRASYELFFKRNYPGAHTLSAPGRRPPGSELQVFSHDGKPLSLPLDSVVLNFAYAIHSSFVGRVLGATINRERKVGVLEPLQDGDVVHLHVGTEIRSLPSGWKRAVPRQTVRRLNKTFNNNYRPGLVAAGRGLLKEKLTQHENVQGYDDASIDSFLEEALSRLNLNIKAYPACLRHLSALPVEDVESIVTETVKAIRRSRRLGLEMLDIAPGLLGTFDRVATCDTCFPQIGNPITGEIHDGSLVLHGEGSSCGVTGVQIKWRKQYCRSQFITIEVNNRRGISAKVLTALANDGIDIIDHAGRELGPGWAVLRIQVHPSDDHIFKAAEQHIRAIDGVIRVVPVGDPVVPALESSLPPRDKVRWVIPAFSAAAAPFIVGPPLPSDEYFYGHSTELQKLHLIYQQAKTSRDRGAVALVVGPPKSGKSSLLLHFVRDLQRARRECAVVSMRPLPTENWNRFSLRLTNELACFVKQVVRRDGLSRMDRRLRAIDLLPVFGRSLQQPLVIAIDDAGSVFTGITSGQQQRDVVEFLGSVCSCPEVVLVLVISNSSLRTLQSQQSNVLSLLSTATKVTVGSIDAGEARSLLEAEKASEVGVQIRVSDDLARSVWEYTGGCPYWMNFIANEMFRVEAKARGRIRFDNSSFEAAKARLRNDSIAFADFVSAYSQTDVRPPVLWAVLNLLARARYRLLPNSDLSEGMLLELLDNHATLTTCNELSRLLDELEARGAIYRSGPTLKMSAPALAEHVLDAYRRKFNG